MGNPGAITSDTDGRLVNVFSLDIADGRVQTIRGILNPDELRHLGPVADNCDRACSSSSRPPASRQPLGPMARMHQDPDRGVGRLAGGPFRGRGVCWERGRVRAGSC
jgi:hypothetical protein